jgi:Domain of unknown function (DU1801)
MAKAVAKTQPTTVSVQDYIARVEHAGRREDAEVLLAMFERATGWTARMWGPSIIGFGRYDYIYDSGHSGSAPVTGFSPRKANMVLYIMPGLARCEEKLAELGKHSVGKSCLYIGRLSSVDDKVLQSLIRDGVAAMKKRWPVFAE